MSVASEAGRGYSKVHSPPSVASSVASSYAHLAYRSTSPLPAPSAHRYGCMTAAAKRYRYLRRLFKFQQMDFQFAFWQMIYLFVAPQKVFRNSMYRKQTKGQFARDDPAFLVLLFAWLCVTSVCFCIVLGLTLSNLVVFLLYTVFVDTVLVACVVTSVLWALVNKYLVKTTCFDQDVEWGYALDVHLNAYFPSLLILHFFQLFFYHMLLQHDWFISVLIGNSLWLVSVGYYVYITFLGFSAQPILRNTRVFLYAIPFACLVFLVSLGLRYNLCRILVDFYKLRVL